MKKSLFGLSIFLLIVFTACTAQIKNAKTEMVKIYGNCEMCEKTIENAGNVKKVASVDWDKNTKMATITYNTKKTSKEDILKRIALAGYDSEEYKAPTEAYAKLQKCCQYREEKMMGKDQKMCEKCKHGMNHENSHEHKKTDADQELGNPSSMQGISSNGMKNSNELNDVYESYFSLKDALVMSDGSLASVKAKELLNAIKSLDMSKLSTNEHTVWMKVLKDLVFDVEHIEETKEANHQRDHFTTLSKNVYQLFKESKFDKPVYYQYCPMWNGGKGANWLSKEEAIKNPYYGSKMLSCGETKEILD